MSWKYMIVQNLDDTGEDKQIGWEFSESVTSGNGTSIIIPPGCVAVGVTVKVTSGTCKVQASTDKIVTIKAGSGETWIDWDKGSVAANNQDEVSPGASAIRLVAAGGTSEIKVIAK